MTCPENDSDNLTYPGSLQKTTFISYSLVQMQRVLSPRFKTTKFNKDSNKKDLVNP